MDMSNLFEYQKATITFQCSRPASMIWQDMGLGKTVSTLTSISHLIESGYLSSVLILAPVRVCRLVWRQEALKWDHLSHLQFSLILGDRDTRTRGLLRNADIYLMNYENVAWLSRTLGQYYSKTGRAYPFQGIVYDEISKTKNATSNRTKALVEMLPNIRWTTGLTGTPAPNGLKDLHGQYLVLDGGATLGRTKEGFSERFLYKKGFKMLTRPGADSEIQSIIGDKTLQMSAADYNPLPDLIENDIYVELPDAIRAKYDQLELDFFFHLDSGESVEVFNMAALTNKCLQFSNGAVYPVPGLPAWEEVHQQKLDALVDIIDEASGHQVLCAYQFKSDAQRIMARFKHLNPINMTECKTEKSLLSAMNRWANGDCPLMIGHPASMGHGIDRLQEAGHIQVWFGLNWSLDLYDQMNARLRRQGQGRPVICHRIITTNTLDSVQAEALRTKASDQNSLRKVVHEYRLRKQNAAFPL